MTNGQHTFTDRQFNNLLPLYREQEKVTAKINQLVSMIDAIPDGAQITLASDGKSVSWVVPEPENED